MWDTVHQMMKTRRRENGSHEVQPFAGLVKYADCGSSLNVSYDGKRGRYTGFSCWVYKNYGKQRCTSHAIGWKTLNTLVLEDIRRNARWAKIAERDYAQLLINAKQAQQRQDTERQKRELKQAEKRLCELEKISNKLYEDRALEKITEERYQSMMPAYEQERSVLLKTQKTLTEAISASEQVYDDVEAFLPLVRQYTDLQERNARILNELIEKIVVHEKERDETGNTTQQVDIYYKFIGYINPATMLNEALSPAGNPDNAKPVAIIV